MIKCIPPLCQNKAGFQPHFHISHCGSIRFLLLNHIYLFLSTGFTILSTSSRAYWSQTPCLYSVGILKCSQFHYPGACCVSCYVYMSLYTQQMSQCEHQSGACFQYSTAIRLHTEKQLQTIALVCSSRHLTT